MCFDFNIMKLWILILWLLVCAVFRKDFSHSHIIFFILSLFLLIILCFYLYIFNSSGINFGAFVGYCPSTIFPLLSKCHFSLFLQYNLNQNSAPNSAPNTQMKSILTEFLFYARAYFHNVFFLIFPFSKQDFI